MSVYKNIKFVKSFMETLNLEFILKLYFITISIPTVQKISVIFSLLHEVKNAMVQVYLSL